MKTLVICTFILFTSLVNGQKLYTFEEQKIVFESKQIPVMSAHLETEEDKLQKSLEGYLEKEMHIKIKEKKTYLISKESKLFPISERIGQMLIITERDLKGVNVYVSARIGPDLYINSVNFGTEINNMSQLLNRFSYEYMNKEIKNKLTLYKSDLNKNKKDLKKSQKKIKQNNDILDKLLEEYKNTSGDEKEVVVSHSNAEIDNLNTAIETEKVISNDLSENIQKLELLVDEYEEKYKIVKNRNKIYSKQ